MTQSMFSKDEGERIAQVVAEVERRTAGEIVVAEVPRSDDYAEVRLFATTVVGLCGGAAGHLLWPALSVGMVLAIQLAAGLATWWITGTAAVLRALVPAVRVARATERAAHLAFLEYSVFRTRDRTGVLIFLSGLEHRVVILGDEGIHARVQDAGWSELVAALVQAIKLGRAGEGVCEVITRLGETLAQVVPPRDDDTNELSDQVRRPWDRF